MTGYDVRVRLHDAIAKRGFDLPAELRNSPPMVVWRHGCRGLILRLYRYPDCWVLLTEQFSEPLDAWLSRMGMTREEYDGSIVLEAGRVNGLDKVLPAETIDWPTGEFEVGCARHAIGRVPLAWLREDADEALATRRQKKRSIVGSTPVT